MTQTFQLPSAALLAITLVLAPMASAHAQSKADEHTAHHPDAAASAGAAKAKGLTKAPAKNAAPAEAATPAASAASGMHGHMGRHCKDMHKIMAIQDPVKRQKAMDDHMKEGNCDMMKDGTGGGMGMGGGASAPMDMKPGMGK